MSTHSFGLSDKSEHLLTPQQAFNLMTTPENQIQRSDRELWELLWNVYHGGVGPQCVAFRRDINRIRIKTADPLTQGFYAATHDGLRWIIYWIFLCTLGFTAFGIAVVNIPTIVIGLFFNYWTWRWCVAARRNL